MSYTAIETNRLLLYYKDGMPIQGLANIFSRSEASIIAKLSSEEVYKAPKLLSKVTGHIPTTKEQYVNKICQELHTDYLLGLQKAPKTTLVKLLQLIQEKT